MRESTASTHAGVAQCTWRATCASRHEPECQTWFAPDVTITLPGSMLFSDLHRPGQAPAARVSAVDTTGGTDGYTCWQPVRRLARLVGGWRGCRGAWAPPVPWLRSHVLYQNWGSRPRTHTCGRSSVGSVGCRVRRDAYLSFELSASTSSGMPPARTSGWRACQANPQGADGTGRWSSWLRAHANASDVANLTCRPPPSHATPAVRAHHPAPQRCARMVHAVACTDSMCAAMHRKADVAQRPYRLARSCLRSVRRRARLRVRPSRTSRVGDGVVSGAWVHAWGVGGRTSAGHCEPCGWSGGLKRVLDTRRTECTAPGAPQHGNLTQVLNRSASLQAHRVQGSRRTAARQRQPAVLGYAVPA